MAEEVITIKLEGEGSGGQPLDRAAPGGPQVKVNPVVLYQQMAREVERLEKAVLARAGGSMANAPGILQGELAAKAAGKAADMPLYDLILHLGDVADAFDQLDAAFGTIIMPLDEAKGALKLLEEQTAKNAAAAKEAAAHEKFLAEARAELEKLAPTVKPVAEPPPIPERLETAGGYYRRQATEQMEKERRQRQEREGIEHARRQIDPEYARKQDMAAETAQRQASRQKAAGIGQSAHYAAAAGVPGAGVVAGVASGFAAAGPAGALAAVAGEASKLVGSFANLDQGVTSLAQTFSPLVGTLMEGADRLSRKFAQYSPELAANQARLETQQIVNDIQRAREHGPELAEFQTRKFEADQKLQEAQLKFIEAVLPLLNVIADIIGDMGEGIGDLVKLVAPIAKLLSESGILKVLTGSPLLMLMKTIAGATEETARNSRKTDAEWQDFGVQLDKLAASVWMQRMGEIGRRHRVEGPERPQGFPDL